MDFIQSSFNSFVKSGRRALLLLALLLFKELPLLETLEALLTLAKLLSLTELDNSHRVFAENTVYSKEVFPLEYRF